MEIFIEKDIFDQYSDVHIGIVVAKNINNRINQQEATFVLRESEKHIRQRLENSSIIELPEIKKWRETYRRFGAKKGRRISIEALAKRAVKGDAIPSISPLVDLYNSISLRYIFPCGGEDLGKVKNYLKLGFAKGNENFQRIGSEENEPPYLGEVVYTDNAGCLCRCWNWREADRTKLTQDTENAILVIETLSAEREKEFMNALKKLSELVSSLLNGETEIYILNKNNPSIEID